MRQSFDVATHRPQLTSIISSDFRYLILVKLLSDSHRTKPKVINFFCDARFVYLMSPKTYQTDQVGKRALNKYGIFEGNIIFLKP